MTAEVTTDSVERAARALLDERIASVRELAIARQARNDAREQLDVVERADAAAYSAAQRAGWSTEELRQVGLEEPDRKAPGRPRKTASGRRSVSPRSAAEQPS